MSGKIEKLDQRTGQPGRPKQVEVRGVIGADEVQIVGGGKRAGEVEILDRTSPIQDTEVEGHIHFDKKSFKEALTDKEDRRRTGVQIRTPKERTIRIKDQ